MGTHVVRDGWYGQPGRRRQRWRCTDDDGLIHRFAEPLPRLVIGAQDEIRECLECATLLEPWEGQPAPRLYGFTARDVAATLTWVAAGSSYRDASARIRSTTGRPLATTVPPRQKGERYRVPPNRHGQLASDWTETFASVLWRAYAPAEWPSTLLIDEDELRYSSIHHARGIRAFYVLAAMGYDQYRRPYVADLKAVAKTGIDPWSTFLSALPGTPEWVVGDRGYPSTAAANVWEWLPEIRACEWHMANNLEQALPPSVRKEDPFRKTVRQAFRSVEAWDEFGHVLEERAYLRATNLYRRIEGIVRHQIATRDPMRPNSTGPLEEFFRQLDLTIGDRASKMTNQSRANALLKLLAMSRNGWVDDAQWAELIRDHLAAYAGRPPDQRRHTDSRSSPSLRTV